MLSLMVLGPWMVGAWAGLRAPFWTSGGRLHSVVDERYAAAAGTHAIEGLEPAADPRVVAALLAAKRALALLSRSRFIWRNTCLYRSVAECLVLRHYGRAAFVRIGVRRDAGDASAGVDEHLLVQAHAWVMYAGPERVEPQRERFRALARPHG